MESNEDLEMRKLSAIREAKMASLAMAMTNAEQVEKKKEDEKGFFDAENPAWKLVIIDLTLGVPACLLFTVGLRFTLKAALAGVFHFGADGFGVGLEAESTTGGGGCGEGIAWERLLTGAVFVIANSFLVLALATKIKQEAVKAARERSEKKERVRLLREKTMWWKEEEKILRGVLDAVEIEKTLTPTIERCKRLIETYSIEDFDVEIEIDIDDLDLSGDRNREAHRCDVARAIADSHVDPVFLAIMEEQRRRSGGVPPESLPTSPLLGGDSEGGFGGATVL